MPKLKTKSGAKKRFKFTASGKVKTGGANHRHRMIRKSSRSLREQKGTHNLAECETQRIKRWMPYGGGI